MHEAPFAVILFAHGSRDARWREPVEAVARRMSTRQPDVSVACAYLELVEPDLPTAAKRLIADGARSLRVVPLFLGMGKHVREDLPQLVDALRAAHPDVVFSLAPAVGETTEVIDLLADIALRS
ncbi:sirohydrochlorin chelatase [Variovorax sp. N23]|uniref:sirohydrochlorin chelatase n=1 Tax=Variovorax sp. N23 TaxID=2980555 RepID=UPI0021C7360D|nr:CbiX/SirB N-terminal domain-containing protein [Variovorax sp. N23]MCU4118862.1 CbiX/SirB N-terminal domain-containing protein [Variovorax sp. N23]